MDEDHPRNEIARLEARIEALAASIERGRKIAFAARAAIVFGAMLTAAMALGAVRLDGLTLLLALSAILGGIVLLGSNRSTINETAAALGAAEAERASLINRISLRVIEGGLSGNGKANGGALLEQ
jgi:hypothetical protein